MTTVRNATVADEAQLMDLCYALHEDNGIFEMDKDRVRDMLARAFNRQGGLIGVIDGNGKIDAAIFLLISSFWYSRQNHLEELFSFVRPECRHSNYASSLLGFAKQCSDRVGIPLMIGVITNKRMEAKVRFYRTKLGIPAGAFFLYNSPRKPEAIKDVWRSPRGRRHPKRNDLPLLTGT